jgi:hypothetical protein
MLDNSFDDIFTKDKKELLVQVSQIVFLVLLVLGLGVYLGNILFGSNSVEVLTNIQTQQSYLEDKIISLREENANLQKEYFELKNLEPE